MTSLDNLLNNSESFELTPMPEFDVQSTSSNLTSLFMTSSPVSSNYPEPDSSTTPPILKKDEKKPPKVRVRRLKANARERSRMHGLNDALEHLRKFIPLAAHHHQKLSKIETLRLARNYIKVLSNSLNTPFPPSHIEYAQMLSQGLSQTTTNLIASALQVHPRILLQDSMGLSSASLLADQPTVQTLPASFPCTPPPLRPVEQVEQYSTPAYYAQSCKTSTPQYNQQIAFEPFPQQPQSYITGGSNADFSNHNQQDFADNSAYSDTSFINDFLYDSNYCA